MKNILFLLCIVFMIICVESGLQSNFVNNKYRDPISPVTLDKESDCMIRNEAYKFGKYLFPERGGLKSVYDGLQLHNCNISLFDDIPMRVPDMDSVHSEPIVYVDIKSGSDKNSGSFKQPFKTIQKALDFLRSFQSHKTLFLREGEYVFTEALHLSSLDSDLTISSYNNEKVVFTGSEKYSIDWIPYKVNQFDIFKDNNVLLPMYPSITPLLGFDIPNRALYKGNEYTQEQCQQECLKDLTCTAFVYYINVSEITNKMCYFIIDGEFTFQSMSGVVSGVKLNIYKADLSSFNIQQIDTLLNKNKRLIRARYPNGNPEHVFIYSEQSSYLKPKNVRWTCCKSFGRPKETIISSPKREDSLYSMYRMATNGVSVQWTPSSSYWALNKPVGGNAKTYSIPTNLTIFDDSMSLRIWKTPQKGILHAFHPSYWGYWMFEIDFYERYNVTRMNKVMPATSLGWTYGGFQEARGAHAGADYFIENIFEELDSPDEWYYDAIHKQLYLYPNGTIENYKVIEISKTKRLLEIMGDHEKNVHDINIIGITFQNTESTFMSVHEVPSGGDIAIHRGGAIFVEDAERITISYNTLHTLGGNAIFFSNHVTESILDHNIIHNIGDSGILFIGSTEENDGCAPHHPSNNIVQYNIVYDTGIYQKQSGSFMQSKSAHTTIKHNIFFNAPRAGINFNDAFGGGNYVFNNLLFNTVRETADHGNINTWDRIPYLTTYRTGAPSVWPQKSITSHNFLLGNYNSLWPLDHDDGSCFYHDNDNVIIYGGFKSYLGHSNSVVNNLYIFPDIKMADDEKMKIHVPYPSYCISSFGATKKSSGYNLIFVNNTGILNTRFLSTYTDCSIEMSPYTDYNTFYTTTNKLRVLCDFNDRKGKILDQSYFDKHTKIIPKHPSLIKLAKMIEEKVYNQIPDPFLKDVMNNYDQTIYKRDLSWKQIQNHLHENSINSTIPLLSRINQIKVSGQKQVIRYNLKQDYSQSKMNPINAVFWIANIIVLLIIMIYQLQKVHYKIY